MYMVSSRGSTQSSGVKYDTTSDKKQILNYRFKDSHIGFLNNNTDSLQMEYWNKIRAHLNKTHLNSILDNFANGQYQSAKPFPHFSEDGMFPLSVLLAACQEIPDNPILKTTGCVEGSTKCFNKANEKTQKYKNAFDDETLFGPATAALFAFLKSSTFVKFLEYMTKIEGLIPDPHYRGSGIHQTLPGGNLNVHADFNRYVQYDMHRRVNVFIYLNPDWEESYGGHLELWSKDLKKCDQHILPTLGRFVAFSSTDFSYHGHPQPLSCPEGRSRRSLAMYYYTRTRPTSECINNNCYSSHSTIFKKTDCLSCTEKKCAAV
eukprot:gene10116-13597_t